MYTYIAEFVISVVLIVFVVVPGLVIAVRALNHVAAALQAAGMR